ncbi:MAG TPA: DNA-binding protein [Anaerolineae bacterium]|nr:DNA-binding protein [Anaerolineae bacterium]
MDCMWGAMAAMTGNGDFLTASQVANMCGVSSRTVRRWVRAGFFPGTKRGLGKTSPYRIPREAVESFIARRLKELGMEGLDQV